MRCPHCAAEIEDGSSFCGVCGRRTLLTPAQKPPPPEPGTSLASSSVFELPVTPGARALRVALVLALDVVLAGSGVAMAASWWKSRERATPIAASSPDATPVRVELGTPGPDAARVAPGPRPDARPGAAGGATTTTRPDAAGTATTTTTPPRPPDAGGFVNPFPHPDAPPVVTPPRPVDAAPVVTPPLPPDAPPVVTPAADGAVVASDEFADKVQAVVQGNMTQVKRCYERAAKQGTNSQPLEGKIVVNASVTTQGVAANVVVVENTTGSEELQACVQALVQSWSFPPAPEETDFVWPFVFKAPR